MVPLIVAFAAVVGILLPAAASAHCPLCTAGAGILAVAAAAIGVSPMAIGVFIGAFAVALGLWAVRATWRFRFPMKAAVFAVGSFLLTVWPLAPLFDSYTSVFVSVAGEYGTAFNRTYLLNRFVVGSVIGAVLLLLAPALSRRVTALRKGALLPYQGMTITFGLLLLSSVLIQFLVL